MSDEAPKLLEFEEGFVEIPVTYEELFAVIHILEYSKLAFEHLVTQSQGDAELADVFKARAEICKAFAEKFSAVAKVGQPLDKSKH